MLPNQSKLRDFITLHGSAAASINIHAEPERGHLSREGDMGCRPVSVADLWMGYL
jgi:hypothetical protein